MGKENKEEAKRKLLLIEELHPEFRGGFRGRTAEYLTAQGIKIVHQGVHDSPSKEKNMTEETTYTKLNPALETDLAQAFTHAMTHEDIESIVNLFAPDGEWVIMATGETFRGLDR